MDYFFLLKSFANAIISKTQTIKSPNTMINDIPPTLTASITNKIATNNTIVSNVNNIIITPFYEYNN